MCSAPVQVKLQVSLQQMTCIGELSPLTLLAGKIIDMSVFFCVATSPEDSLATRWAASNKTNAAGYDRLATAAMNGVLPYTELYFKIRIECF